MVTGSRPHRQFKSIRFPLWSYGGNESSVQLKQGERIGGEETMKLYGLCSSCCIWLWLKDLDWEACFPEARLKLKTAMWSSYSVIFQYRIHEMLCQLHRYIKMEDCKNLSMNIMIHIFLLCVTPMFRLQVSCHLPVSRFWCATGFSINIWLYHFLLLGGQLVLGQGISGPAKFESSEMVNLIIFNLPNP